MNDLNDFIRQVKNANDIVDVIGSHLELRQKGTAFWARCPFHGEKTASFCVNRNLQIYKCFGCGESGDVIKFIQKFESCTFWEALEILAKRANLKMPETSFQKKDKDYDERKKKKDLYMNICRDTAVFYYKRYYSEQGKTAREYVEKRGFAPDTVKKFGIGYSPDRTSLVSYLAAKKYSVEDCLKCGVVQRASSGAVYDALSNRLIIPIFNMQGKVIAFGGRGLDEKTVAYGKYKNTSDTPLFTKKDNLFAINIAKEQKQQTSLPYLVIVEGYMDVIAMYQAGFKKAVASMGTSLTENQAKWLSRLAETVYICYDGDAAGQKATVRGMDILDKAGLEVKVMSVPENLDPDEYIKKYGAEEFEKLIDAALPLPDYKLKLLVETYPINSRDSAARNNAMPKYIKGAVKMLRGLDDERQAQYVRAVSVITGHSEEYFRRKLAEKDLGEKNETQSEVMSADDKAKYFVAACVLRGEPYASISEKPICRNEFLSEIYDYILECNLKEETPSADMIYTVCPDASAEEFSRIIDIDLSESKRSGNEKFYADCKKRLNIEKLEAQKAELKSAYEQDPSDEILEKLAELSRKISAEKGE